MTVVALVVDTTSECKNPWLLPRVLCLQCLNVACLQQGVHNDKNNQQEDHIDASKSLTYTSKIETIIERTSISDSIIAHSFKHTQPQATTVVFVSLREILSQKQGNETMFSYATVKQLNCSQLIYWKSQKVKINQRKKLKSAGQSFLCYIARNSCDDFAKIC